MMEHSERMIDLDCRCRGCGRQMRIRLTERTYNDSFLLEVNRENSYCNECVQLSNEEGEKRRKAAAEAARLEELRNTYRSRREGSMIDKYLLSFDPNHPDANRGLWDWMASRTNRSVLLSGESGLGKTRVLSCFAEMALKDRSVCYRTAPDLVDELGSAFQRKENWGLAQLERFKNYDLLVIDDLGKEAVSDTRVMRLWQLIDARYTAHVQRLAGRTPRYGWQLWISSNWNAGALIDRMGRTNTEPTMRRLLDITEIWKGNE